MIRALKALFETPVQETQEDLRHRLQLASAALLIETARADFTQGGAEEEIMKSLLCSTLKLDEQEVQQLVEQATVRVDEATSLYDFTRLINDHFTAEQKLQLIHNMWAVAWADDSVDKYEEHLIRQVAELTYVPHQDYIRSKHKARDNIHAL
ncbi:MAG: TerB family tellurite resistance protein [Halioglobus sp.]